jgi:hypothetical protein
MARKYNQSARLWLHMKAKNQADHTDGRLTGRHRLVHSVLY